MLADPFNQSLRNVAVAGYRHELGFVRICPYIMLATIPIESTAVFGKIPGKFPPVHDYAFAISRDFRETRRGSAAAGFFAARFFVRSARHSSSSFLAS